MHTWYMVHIKNGAESCTNLRRTEHRRNAKVFEESLGALPSVLVRVERRFREQDRVVLGGDVEIIPTVNMPPNLSASSPPPKKKTSHEGENNKDDCELTPVNSHWLSFPFS